MIGTLTYQEILETSEQLKTAIEDITEIANKNGVEALADFISTVEGYSKYLVTTVELNQDADEVLKELSSKLK